MEWDLLLTGVTVKANSAQADIITMLVPDICHLLHLLPQNIVINGVIQRILSLHLNSMNLGNKKNSDKVLNRIGVFRIRLFIINHQARLIKFLADGFYLFGNVFALTITQ